MNRKRVAVIVNNVERAIRGEPAPQMDRFPACCANCHFWTHGRLNPDLPGAYVADDDAAGECHKHAPTITHPFLMLWPPVPAYEWCGEYTPRQGD